MAHYTDKTILDTAEQMIRRRGYHGFSFRDVAEAVGIKSASVHYHYRTKTRLAVTVVERYSRRFLKGLGPADTQAPEAHAVLARYRAAYRQALTGGRMCPCGMLAAERDGLPDAVRQAVRRFFIHNRDWLADALARTAEHEGTPRPRLETQALAVIAGLEGAMLLARGLEDDPGDGAEGEDNVKDRDRAQAGETALFDRMAPAPHAVR